MHGFDGNETTRVPTQADTRPWHREMYVWLLIAIPVATLIAGFVTLFLALHGADVEVPHP